MSAIIPADELMHAKSENLSQRTANFIATYGNMARLDLLGFSISIHALFFGLWLLLPFDSFSNSASYAGMAALAPEQFWGLAFIGIGIVMQVGLVLRRIRVQQCGFLMLAILWAGVVGSMVYTNLASTGVPTYFTLSAVCAVNFVRIMGRKR